MKNQLINKILGTYFKKLPDIDYFIVANTLKSNANTLLAQASADELFSRTEFAEIASAIFDDFGFVNVFYSEQDFINFVLNNNLSREIFVFNYARNGTKEGKKSLVPAFCDLFKIKYSGSNAFVISLLRNKFIYSNLLSKFNIPVPETCLYENKTFIGNPKALSETKIIVKNVCESASMNLTEDNVFIFDEKQTAKLEELKKKMNTKKILLQKFIEGKECEVLVFQDGNEYYAFQPVEIILKRKNIIDSKTSNSYDYGFADLSDTISSKVVQQIMLYAEKAARILNIKDYARFDFRINNSNEIYLIDIAGTPYSIKHSSISYLFCNIYGYKYKDIYKSIAALSYHNYLT